MSYDWNIKTLRFEDPAIEADFWQSEVAFSNRAVKMLAYFAGGAGMAECVFRAAFVERGLSLFRIGTFAIFISVILIGKIYGLTSSRMSVKARHRIGLVFFTLLVLSASHLPYIAPRAAVTGLFFYLIVIQIFNLLMPYSQIVKLWINALTVVILCFQHAFFPLLDSELFQVVALSMVLAGGASTIMAYLDERNRRSGYVLRRSLEFEKARSEELLVNILPESIAETLKAKSSDEKIAIECPDAVVMFADIVGFTELSGKLQPRELVRVLDDLFSRFDAVIDIHGLEKIKTIGDAYMAAAGVPDPVTDPLNRVAEAALDILAAVERYSNLAGYNLKVRIGFHFGPVVAGIIGRKRFLFDLWGQTVNVASRLESTAHAGTIHITAETAKDLAKCGYQTRHLGSVNLRGVGIFETCNLLPRVTPSAVC